MGAQMEKENLVLLFVLLFDCGGGGGSGDISPPSQIVAPNSFNLGTIQACAAGVKTFQLT